MNALIDSKRIMVENRVALCKEVREKLSVNIGDIVEFVEEETTKRVYIQKAEA